VPTHTFKVNGQTVSVDVEDDVRLLWVLRDLLGIHGPKYGCGLDVCRACTSHINGLAFTPCSVPVSDIKPTDEITTIEGLPATVGKPLHPMQEAWLSFDVPSAATASPARSWRPSRWSRMSSPRAGPSPRQIWTASATSAGVALTPEFARRLWPASRTCSRRMHISNAW